MKENTLLVGIGSATQNVMPYAKSYTQITALGAAVNHHWHEQSGTGVRKPVKAICLPLLTDYFRFL